MWGLSRRSFMSAMFHLPAANGPRRRTPRLSIDAEDRVKRLSGYIRDLNLGSTFSASLARLDRGITARDRNRSRRFFYLSFIMTVDGAGELRSPKMAHAALPASKGA